MKKGDLSRERESSEQFVWYIETETQLRRWAIMPSIQADWHQDEVIYAAATSVGCHAWSVSALGSQTAWSEGISGGAVCPW